MCSRSIRILCEVVLGRHGALHEADVDPVGVVLGVDERAVDEVDPLGDARAGARRGRRTTCGSPSSRRARSWRGSACAVMALVRPRDGGEVRQERAPGLRALARSTGPSRTARPVGTHLDALAAAGAGRRLAPRRPHVGDDPLVDAGAHHAPGAGALDLGADPDAADAHDAAVVVDREQRVRRVDRDPGVDQRQLEVVEADRLRQVLELAVVVRDADRAHVVPLEEQHLDDRAAVLLEPRRGWS